MNLDKNYPGPCHCQVCWYPWISFSHSNVTREMTAPLHIHDLYTVHSIRGWLELKGHWFSIVIISSCNGALFFVESCTYHADLIFWHRCTCIMILVFMNVRNMDWFWNESFQRYNKALDAKKDRSKSAQGFGPKGTRGGHPNQVIVV